MYKRLTVALVLVVVRDKGGAIAHAIIVGANARPVQAVLPAATDDAIA